MRLNTSGVLEYFALRRPWHWKTWDGWYQWDDWDDWKDWDDWVAVRLATFLSCGEAALLVNYRQRGKGVMEWRDRRFAVNHRIYEG